MKIIHNDRVIYDGAPVNVTMIANESGLPEVELVIEYTAIELRDITRAAIKEGAGDVSSILGTTADGAQLAIHGLATLVAALATADSLADVRKAAEPFAQLSTDFLAKVQSGEVVLPFMLKGIDAVVSDIETRATAVSSALQASAKE